jgi:hypothetical protein
MPALASVGAATVVVGFARGHLRQSASVDAFRITKHPITVAQYRACVTKGGCAAPSTPASEPPADAGAEAHDAFPMASMTVEEAEKYCAWVGGALPTSEQWMLAARGASPMRFAWGNDEPTCEQHPGADGACVQVTADRTVAASHATGAHPKGASPYGVEDVLLTPRELIGASPDAYFGSCATPNAGCVVYGIRPGAIDSVEPVRDRASREGSPVATSAFRCVVAEVK